METKDVVLASLSVAALLWAIVSFLLNRAGNKASAALAKKAEEHAAAANTLSEKANAIAEQTGRRLTAEAELSVLRLINEARMRVGELFVRVTDLQAGRLKLTADETRQMTSLQLAYEEAVEALLNSYELACGMYLDKGKLDEQRFYRQYHDEIRKLFDFPDPYNKRLHPVNSPYVCIRKVREEWNNLEKG